MLAIAFLFFISILGLAFGIHWSVTLSLKRLQQTGDANYAKTSQVLAIIFVISCLFFLNWPMWGPLLDVVGDWNRGQADDMPTPLGSGFYFYSMDVVKELPQPLQSRYMKSDLKHGLGIVTGLACYNQKVYLKFDNGKIKHIEHNNRMLISDNAELKSIQWLNIEKFSETPCNVPPFVDTLPWWFGLLIGPLVALSSLVAIVSLRPKAELI